MPRLKTVDDLMSHAQEFAVRHFLASDIVRVCMTGCHALGAGPVYDTFKRELEAAGLTDHVCLVKTGCQAVCANAPVVTIDPKGIVYGGVEPEDVREIVARTVAKGEVIERLCCSTNPDGSPQATERDFPFLGKQKRSVLAKCGKVDPTEINIAMAEGGYLALGEVLQHHDPEQVIATVGQAGLRGRGGAGFPAAVKWEYCRQAEGAPKYLVCNADEGDPGAFMDRALLEGDPHSVLEGMLIAAYAIGARFGYVYVRAEYPLAVEHMTRAVHQASELGLLGDDILGTGFSFEISVTVGAGAFVCGEETALLSSIEGRRGNPRVRPPFPAQAGLWGKPTIVNNVETLANVPLIFNKGAEAYAAIGTERSKGTKIFSVSGFVRNPGLVEVPFGTPLRTIISDIAGGAITGRAVKALQVGGPCGGILPVSMLDLPADFESFEKAGAMVGSGGIIVLDEGKCVVDIVKSLAAFAVRESCGKCSPCRIGTQRLLDVLTAITEGRGMLADLDLLVELGDTLRDASLCPLGKAVTTPALSTLRYFRDEYLAHIEEQRCPAGVCRALARSPCDSGCPAGVNVPQYVALVQREEFDRAADLIRRRNPFACVCGKLCTHTCETLCRRGELDEPVPIMHLEDVAAGTAGAAGNQELLEAIVESGKTVGVVGAGPAGLTAAYFLALRGHGVTVYEAADEPGGMLIDAMPSERLPRDAISRDVDYIRRFGVEIQTGVRVGKDVDLAALRQRHDAVFLAVGAPEVGGMGIPGEDADGVLAGTTFLRQVRAGTSPPLGSVVVVGESLLAIAAARAAKRLGAETVRVIGGLAEPNVRAVAEELAHAREEGVEILLLAKPVAITEDDGRARALRCVRLELSAPDHAGQRQPVPTTDSEFEVACTTVVIALPRQPSVPWLSVDGLERNGVGGLQVDPYTQVTAVQGLFAGGDCCTGEGTVVDAVADGQRAAMAIDRYLGGRGELPPNSDMLAANLRPASRRTGQTGQPSAAVQEASRCLRCDLERLQNPSR